jgi:hypothetical protein
MRERPNRHAWKACVGPAHRGFESHSLRTAGPDGPRPFWTVRSSWDFRPAGFTAEPPYPGPLLSALLSNLVPHSNPSLWADSRIRPVAAIADCPRPHPHAAESCGRSNGSSATPSTGTSATPLAAGNRAFWGACSRTARTSCARPEPPIWRVAIGHCPTTDAPISRYHRDATARRSGADDLCSRSGAFRVFRECARTGNRCAFPSHLPTLESPPTHSPRAPVTAQPVNPVISRV